MDVRIVEDVTAAATGYDIVLWRLFSSKTQI
jgi:hypothetical protein